MTREEAMEIETAGRVGQFGNPKRASFVREHHVCR
jgi:hypothetical protein